MKVDHAIDHAREPFPPSQKEMQAEAENDEAGRYDLRNEERLQSERLRSVEIGTLRTRHPLACPELLGERRWIAARPVAFEVHPHGDEADDETEHAEAEETDQPQGGVENADQQGGQERKDQIVPLRRAHDEIMRDNGETVQPHHMSSATRASSDMRD